MEDIVAFRLNELFKKWATNERLIRSELLITLTTGTGDKVTVHPSSPVSAANYLRRFIKGEDPYFHPGDVRCDSPTQSRSRPGSILFKGFGYVRDNANHEHYRIMLHLKFTGRRNEGDKIGEMESEGNVSFREHFGDDMEQPNGFMKGPTIHEFISQLESAGQLWTNINFRTASTRMINRHQPLQLVTPKR